MFGFTAIELARMQFAFTVSAHITFPAFSIGLASFLATLNFLHFITKKEVFLQVFNYWKTIFAVVFGMGVVSGIVMSYQFGTNWPIFADKTGPVLGPMLGYEVMSAFFLEAGFLGVMLFGRERVGPKLHLFATAMVALGTLISATWILAVNSWMQTPAGYSINEVGQFVPESWFEIVFNPSFPYRFVHMVLAAYLTTALVVGAVGAWHLLKDSSNAPAKLMFSMTMWMLITVAPLQILAGDEHGINTLEHQPAKIAAMEGHYYAEEGGTPLLIFGFPNDKTERVDYAVKIPYLGSLILTRSLTGSFQGLTEFPKEDRPPALILFWTFRIMVAIGFGMLGLGLWGVFKRWRGSLYESRWLQKAAILMGPMGFVAVLAGWITTEVGRQPWTVYGLLRTVDSAGPLEASAVGTSLLVFIFVYFTLFGAGTVYILRLMAGNPDAGDEIHDLGPTRTAGITPGLAETLSKEDL